MNKETLGALKRCIEKYKSYQNATSTQTVFLDRKHCALCSLFNRAPGNGSCEGCPVKDSTGQKYCDNTPYEDVRRTRMRWETSCCASSEDARRAFREACKQEEDFLTSLLPTEGDTK